MLILDDIVAAPFHGLFWVFRKIHEAAREALEDRKQQVTSSLSELYMELDTGKITEQEFDAREKELLARLDALTAQLKEVEEGRAREEEDDESAPATGSNEAERVEE